MKELIRHAAVKCENGQIMIGKHHGDCFHKGFSMGLKMCSKGEAQGFMTNKGRFLNRKEGAGLALENNQIEKATPMLFSENFWCKTYNGKHLYSETKGYELSSSTQDFTIKDKNDV